MKHRTTREGDEYVCSCGLRWDIDEDDPHPVEGELPGMWDESDLSGGWADSEGDSK